MFNDIERVGFAGLGAMGAGIAQRLLDAGFAVVGWNRTKARAQGLIDAGMGWADTPRELAASVDVLFTMLTNTAAVADTADGPDGVLAGIRPGTVWADISTIAPDASIALAERVAGLPDTGQSRNLAPVAATRSAIATLASGAIVLMSAHTVPGRRPARMPSGPSAISATAAVFVSIVKRTSTDAASPRGVSAQPMPASRRSWALAFVRFQPTTVKSASSSRCAMPAPMAPRPANPTRSMSLNTGGR